MTIRVEATAADIALQAVTGQQGYALPYSTIDCMLPPSETRAIRLDAAVHQDEQGWRHVRVPVT